MPSLDFLGNVLDWTQDKCILILKQTKKPQPPNQTTKSPPNPPLFLNSPA